MFEIILCVTGIVTLIIGTYACCTTKKKNTEVTRLLYFYTLNFLNLMTLCKNKALIFLSGELVKSYFTTAFNSQDRENHFINNIPIPACKTTTDLPR